MPTVAPKIKMIFDKQALSQNEFVRLVKFLIQNEDYENVKWICAGMHLDFESVKIEDAYTHKNIIGLQIFTDTNI